VGSALLLTAGLAALLTAQPQPGEHSRQLEKALARRPHSRAGASENRTRSVHHDWRRHGTAGHRTSHRAHWSKHYGKRAHRHHYARRSERSWRHFRAHGGIRHHRSWSNARNRWHRHYVNSGWVPDGKHAWRYPGKRHHHGSRQRTADRRRHGHRFSHRFQ
jgi:hypothetical protein